jgi:hypothetical protein
MSEGQDVARAGGNRDADVVGEVLGAIEADETVDTDVFRTASHVPKRRLKGECLAGEPIRAIKDGTAGAPEEASEGTNAHRCGEELFEAAEIDFPLHIEVG